MRLEPITDRTAIYCCNKNRTPYSFCPKGRIALYFAPFKPSSSIVAAAGTRRIFPLETSYALIYCQLGSASKSLKSLALDIEAKWGSIAIAQLIGSRMWNDAIPASYTGTSVAAQA